MHVCADFLVSAILVKAQERWGVCPLFSGYSSALSLPALNPSLNLFGKVTNISLAIGVFILWLLTNEFLCEEIESLNMRVLHFILVRAADDCFFYLDMVQLYGAYLQVVFWTSLGSFLSLAQMVNVIGAYSIAWPSSVLKIFMVAGGLACSCAHAHMHAAQRTHRTQRTQSTQRTRARVHTHATCTCWHI